MPLVVTITSEEQQVTSGTKLALCLGARPNVDGCGDLGFRVGLASASAKHNGKPIC